MMKNTQKQRPSDLSKMAFQQTTNNISVTVEPVFIDDQSDVAKGHYVWAYHVTIENLGGTSVQLLSRYWHITDARGVVQEVEGDGVIGEQPVIEPGQSYQYTSGTPLSTPSGIMQGAYFMNTLEGQELKIAIPAFSLDSPYMSTVLH